MRSSAGRISVKRSGMKPGLAAALIFVIAAPGAPQSTAGAVRDRDIRRTLEADLAGDPAVQAHLLDIEVTEGIVDLSGSVDNILARDRAVRIAGSIRGVRSVIERIDVRPVRVDDRVIRRHVVRALDEDPALEGSEIRPKVDVGVVTLRGEVETLIDKRLAVQAAKRVRGVVGVRDSMAVEPLVLRPDSVILADVRRGLQLDPRVHAEHIDVAVEAGVVKMRGTVAVPAQKGRAIVAAMRAGAVALDADGLRIDPDRAHGALHDVPEEPVTTEAAARAVEDALRLDPRIDSRDITVRAREETIVLSGTVRTLPARYAAGRDARLSTGARQVSNEIKVRPLNRPPDSSIKREVVGRLKWDPLLDRFTFSALVRNGHVYLYGTVDSPWEKRRAARTTARVAGVVEVTNMIRVGTGPWPTKSDARILIDLRRGLRLIPGIEAERIEVSVDDGIVSLEGAVEQWPAYERLIGAAMNAGARGVKTNISVEHDRSFGSSNRDYFDREDVPRREEFINPWFL